MLTVTGDVYCDMITRRTACTRYDLWVFGRPVRPLAPVKHDAAIKAALILGRSTRNLSHSRLVLDTRGGWTTP